MMYQIRYYILIILTIVPNPNNEIITAKYSIYEIVYFLIQLFSPFGHSMLEDLRLVISTMYSMSDEQRNPVINTINDACEQISTIQSAIPKIFLKSVYALLNILEKYIATSDPGVTVLLYDTINANISECAHSYKKEKNKGAIIKFVQLLCYQVSKIFNNPRLQFLNIDKNSEGLNLEQLQKQDPDSALAMTFVELLNQTIDEVNFTDFMPQFILQFYPLATCGNQKIEAAFFICIGEFSKIQGIEQHKNLIQIIYNGINHQNPKVRYYAINTLSCFCKELNSQKFHQKYFQEFIFVIIKGLNQTTEQLACQWLQCFNSFIGNLVKKKQLSQSAEHIMEKVCFFIQHSKGNKIKEYSLDCLVQLTKIPKLFNPQKIQKCFEIFYMIIKSLPIETHKSVVNRAFKCLCEIIVGLKYDQVVEKYIDFTLNTIQNFIEKIQIENLLACWRLLCFSGVKFKNWNMYFPTIFQIAKGKCGNSQYSQRSSGYLTFKYTSICFEEKFSDYLITVLKIILPCLRPAIQNEEIEEVAQICQTIDAIISNQRPKPNVYDNYDIKQNNMMKLKIERSNQVFPQGFLNMISEIFQFYVEFLLKAKQAQNKIKQPILFSLKLAIDHYGDIFPENSFQSIINNYWSIVQNFFADKNFNSFVENQIEQLPEQDQQQINADQSISDPSLNDDEDDEVNSFNRCRIVLPLILGSIIQHMPAPVQILNRTLNEIQREMNSYKDQYDLICVTRYLTSIQQIPFQPINMYSCKIISFFKQNCTNLYPSVRTQIAYSICIMASNTPFTQDFKIKFDDWMEIINKCYNIPKNQFDHDEDFGTCRDNCISVLGYIIHKFGNCFDLSHLYDHWLDNLPLKYDKEQFKTQIDFLTNIVNFEHCILISSNLNEVSEDHTKVIKRVSKMLRIFAEVKYHVEREPNIRQNRDTLRKVKSAVRKILEWPIFKEKHSQIASPLSEEQSAHLSELMERQY